MKLHLIDSLLLAVTLAVVSCMVVYFTTRSYVTKERDAAWNRSLAESGHAEYYFDEYKIRNWRLLPKEGD